MDFNRLNDYIENSFDYSKLKVIASTLPETHLSEESVNKGMWFLDTSKVYGRVLAKQPYLKGVDTLINRLIKRKRIDLKPYPYEGKCKDCHQPIKGTLYKGGQIVSTCAYTDTVKDVPVYAHAIGHLFEHVLSYKDSRMADSYDDEMVLQNVLPLVMEKLMLAEFNDKDLSVYYSKFRTHRFKTMCGIDTMLREIDGTIDDEMLVDSLDYDVSITYEDVEDYCSEIEMGNDPVYKSYCYYVADGLASRMVERNNFKRDIPALLKAKSVEELGMILGQPNIKR